MTRKERWLSPMPILDQPALVDFLTQFGSSSEAYAKHVWKHVFKCTDPQLEEVPNLPEGAAEQLGVQFSLLTSSIQDKRVSVDGTIKLVVRLQDGQMIESVIIRHSDFMPRNTLCVSSQVGCQMGCKFCATGTMNLLGNLWAGEILEQIWHANTVLQLEGDPPVSNVVFMGMGEPLHNYDPVMAAIHGMTDVHRFGIPRKRVSLSTVGVVPSMRRLTTDAPYVQLALSLHAPSQPLREQIVPSASKWPLPEILDALQGYQEAQARSKSKAKIMIEYVMLKDVNDQEETAHELGALLKGQPYWVNLIPYNPTPGLPYETPSQETISNFSAVVQSYGLRTMERNHHGRDVDAACGQLALQNGAAPSEDIEDLGLAPKRHVQQAAPKTQQKRRLKDKTERTGKSESVDDGTYNQLNLREVLVPVLSAILCVLAIYWAVVSSGGYFAGSEVDLEESIL
eukprot:TRINITY_DN5252_c0_g1_i3.p1 TRINITY_DN5252_c0_g1~~TRINITY_DN5252_c0_g1_i3.p1  ORF type:complete len:454 (-),score=95.94 TRINITY_DN5252_c0_g1_i3:203-1564(-)